MVRKIREYYSENSLLRVAGLFLIILLPWMIAVYVVGGQKVSSADYTTLNKKQCQQQAPVSHAKFSELRGPFENAKAVTAACLGCHTERHREIMKTAHWRWEKEDLNSKGESVFLGKRTALNNYCIGTQSNEKSCTRCHIGYGWSDKSFDFMDPNAIDCLVCHDNTGTYKKATGKAGWPEEGAKAPDYATIAANVCSPKRENCGKCHFWGGGGNNVKHGDLEKALLDCAPEVDVHMSETGSDLQCIDCHLTENHNITGRSYVNTYSNTNRVSCEQCHGDHPHQNQRLNDHLARVACQTCHIPVYAKVNATKMYWDWSKAGRLDKEGNPITEHDEDGNHTYLSIKGEFVWKRNVAPEYFWFNGTAEHYRLGDTCSQTPLQINTLNGNYADGFSKIIPVKVHRGKQPYDPVNKMVIQLKTFAEKKGEGGFWMDFNWDTACRIGMNYVGLPFSGTCDFIETEMYMPVNHMVSPATESLSCKDCHSREGRLKNLSGFYLPGRDQNKPIDYAGTAMIIISVCGIFIHLLMRVFAKKIN